VLGDFLANSNEIFFFVFFFSTASPVLYLVLPQDPNIESVDLISKGELLLHAVTKLSPWGFIGVISAFVTRRICAKPLKSGSINRHTEGRKDVP